VNQGRWFRPRTGRLPPIEITRLPGRGASLQAQVEGLIEGYAAGETTYELGTRFSIQRQTVSRILKREGIPLRNQPLSGDEIAAAIDMYGVGLSCQRIAHLLCCNHGTGRRALIGEGVRLRDSHGRER
jgi:hypothetical protein